MSLSASLNIATAGLGLSSRRAEIVASNVANADRPGYARRSAGAVGAGTGLPGSGLSVTRETEPRLVQLRRDAQSALSDANVAQRFAAEFDAAIGDPDAAGSLQDRVARLDAAFVSAASEPSSAIRLSEISQAASDLADHLNRLEDVVQSSRQRADDKIGSTVEQINTDLKDIARLNVDIRRLSSGGHDTATLMDERTVLIDRVSTQIPLRELPREHGAVALVSKAGAILLDGSAKELGFTPHAMTINAGKSASTHLSGLTINGRDVRTDEGPGGVGGAALSALFTLRDETGPEASRRLDAVAADLMERFEKADVAPGLLTDEGSPFSSSAAPGLAGRIEINSKVAPDKPDQHWRLRDGLGATAPGGADATLLLSYGKEMARRVAPPLVGLTDRASDAKGHIATLKSLSSADRVRADDRSDLWQREATGLSERRDGGAVDVDAEMRRLIEIEQAYAANARVIQVVGDMMQRLTEI
ncbi:Flagellar hook-associated protein 1 [Jannaschia seosinensis]|uniref:Flagellar hook-associated protein 1 n=1 Tax=Jannaschia seosinensis TaxID=313367 RepID=A0A0M7B6S3_9RHOB|nr:flagellar basal body rod C-terminal domain-containing protein [Jannaschia seosinensis]CUH35272.1 Flagellar hook-associated protein 1 [Jannaschia seosinensis]